MSFFREARRALLVCLVFGLPSASSMAATWALGNASGYPGDLVTIPLSIKGDGVTNGADIALMFSNTRVTVNHSTGPLPANGSGQCSWNGTNAVAGIIFNASSTPLPNAPTLVCSFQVRILSTARAGITRLQTTQRNCANGTGQPVTCTTEGGAITILGPSASAPSSAPGSATLFVELAPEAAAAASKKAGPGEGLDALRIVVPRRVRWMRSVVPTERSLERSNAIADIDAQFARTLVVRFETEDDMRRAHSLLVRDVQVRSVTAAGPDPVFDATRAPSSKTVGGEEVQYHLAPLHVEQAWQRAKGWGLVGIVDNGITAEHPELRSFSGASSIGGTRVAGGSYLPHLSENLATEFGQSASNLSETQEQVVDYRTEDCDGLDDNLDGKLSFGDPVIGTYGFAGHGTHVAGLIAANGTGTTGVRGTCIDCGLAVRKSSYLYCAGGHIGVANDAALSAEGFNDLSSLGAQVISYSAGRQYSCVGSNDTGCNAVRRLGHLDVVLVAASGNDRTDTNYPARMMDAVSVGGLNLGGTFWDDYPDDCPSPGIDLGCGSNYNKVFDNPSPLITPEQRLQYKQDLTAPAIDVWSTIVPGATWNGSCGDGLTNLGSASDGYGPCTGTSMSTPQVAGIFGLVRSVNPLMTVGSPFYPVPAPFTRTLPSDPFSLDAYGVRDLIAQTTDRAQAGLPNDGRLGFGQPDADAAVRKALGIVRGAQVTNRLTPLFSLYSAAATDYAAVATPQMAMALSYFHVGAYSSVPVGTAYIGGQAVPGYPKFPYEYHNTSTGKSPRAIAMVLTTHRSPSDASPPVVPLYLMERRVTEGAPDFILVSSPSVLQSAANSGYRYLGQQGYVYQYCAPSATCVVPQGAQKLHLKCNNTSGVNDCAVYLDNQASAFAARGYNAFFPGMNNKSEIGYAYAVADVDGDGLVDALENVIGTSTTQFDADGNGLSDGFDSDGDGLSDGAEYPLAHPPVSDPCAGPAIVCPREPWYVFANGFE